MRNIVIKAEGNSQFKKQILKQVKIKEIVSEKLLAEITEEIISDEEEQLWHKDDYELAMAFEKDDYHFARMSDWEKEWFIKKEALAWGLDAMNFTVESFIDHFSDYDSHEKFWEQIDKFEESLDKLEIKIDLF